MVRIVFPMKYVDTENASMTSSHLTTVKFATNVFTSVRLRTESKCVYFVLCCKEVIALMMEAERPLIHLIFFKNKAIEGSFLKYTHTSLF